MRCAKCNSGNPDAEANCNTCNTPLPGQNFTAAVVKLESLLRESKMNEASQQLVKCEAELATAHLSPLQRDLCQARLLMVRGKLYFARRQLSLAQDCARRALTLLDDGPDIAATMAGAAGTLSSVANYNNDYQTGRQYSDMAIAAAQAAGDNHLLAALLNNRGNIERGMGNNDRAIAYYRHSLSEAQATANHNLASLACTNLSFLYEQQGDYAQSLTLAEQGRQLAEQTASKQRIAAAWQAIGSTTSRLGDYAAAEQAMQQALRLLEAGELRAATVEIYTNLAELAWLREDYATMRTMAQKGISNTEGDYREVVQLHAMLVHASLAMQNMEDARRALEQMNKERERHHAPEFRENYFFVLTAAPLLLAARHDWTVAAAAFEQAIAYADAHDDRYTSGQVRLIYAAAAQTQTQEDKARTTNVLTEAQAIFSQLGAVREHDKASAMLAERQVLPHQSPHMRYAFIP